MVTHLQMALSLLLAPAGDGVFRQFQAPLCQHQHRWAALQRPAPLLRRLLCDSGVPQEVLFSEGYEVRPNTDPA